MGRKKKNTVKTEAPNKKDALSNTGSPNEQAKEVATYGEIDKEKLEAKAAKNAKVLDEAKQKKLLELEEAYADIPSNLKLEYAKDADGNAVDLQLDAQSLENLRNIPLVFALKKQKNNEFLVVNKIEERDNNHILFMDEALLRKGTLTDRIKELIKDEVVNVRDKDNKMVSMRISDIFAMLEEIDTKRSNIEENKNSIIEEIQSLATVKDVKKFDVLKDFAADKKE